MPSEVQQKPVLYLLLACPATTVPCNPWPANPDVLIATLTSTPLRNSSLFLICTDEIPSWESWSYGRGCGNEIYANHRKPLAGDAKGRLDSAGREEETLQTQPTSKCNTPVQRVQIDVKVVPRRCIADPQLKLYQYTAIDEYSRYRVLGAYEEQSTFSSADFLSKVVKHFARKGVAVECIQTDNGFEFTNRFSSSQGDLETLFEATARQLGIRHKLIRPYKPRHNGKVERSHREDQKRFYDTHRFYSLADFGGQLAAHQSRSNSRPMRPLHWAAPREVLSSFPVQYV